MLVVPRDLEELDEPSGANFQRFVTALVMAEALSHGLSCIDIDADFRSNHPDGGCDIFVHKGQHCSTSCLIPETASIWSIKSGKGGIDPDLLSKELKKEQHPRLVEHLKNGQVYFWCALQPAGQNERKAMRDRADRVAEKLEIDSKLIRFVWNEHLCQVLNHYPNIIAMYLPQLSSVIRPMMAIAQWRMESPDKKGLKVPFVTMPGAGDLQNRVSEHLLAQTGDAVLHIAGFSGIGKTRTCLETCSTNGTLADTLYIGAFAEIGKDLWRRLSAPDTHLRLIIDEVPLEEVTRLQDRFCDQGSRIRIVSIGPAPRGQARRQRDKMLVQLEPPDETSGVLPVVTSAAPELEENVRRSIAHFSGHDLRLALLLVEASRKHGSFSTVPLQSYEDVWTRIMALFRGQINDSNRFREIYELLTLAIDVGHSGDHREELALLARFFNKDTTSLDRAILDAHECGLGERLKSFFEAKPAALAVWLFQERLWPLLQHRLAEFIEAKPSARLFRRFLERCQETSGSYREEVEAKVGHFFLTLLGTPHLKTLGAREPSRIFQAWAEFDPNRGLEWLEAAVSRASDDDLREFDGENDGSGGWRGRRQAVWLCEHLACFSEHFRVCERILFRLAQVETEVRIGNNSTNTWREMFLPALANTELPFKPRLELLSQRLIDATEKSIDLVVSAFYAAIDRHISRFAPPRIVGGRIVPDQWQPNSVHELEQNRVDAVRTLLQSIPQLREALGQRANTSIVNETVKLLAYPVVSEFRHAVDRFLGDESLVRQLRFKLEDWLSWYDELNTVRRRPEWFDSVAQWRDELAPDTLTARIRDLTSRDYWTFVRISSRQGAVVESTDTYRTLAQEMLEQPDVIRAMSEWLTSPEAISAPSLWYELGACDAKAELLTTVLEWLNADFGTHLVANYLAGFAKHFGSIPEIVLRALDESARIRPARVLHITLFADATERGLRRLEVILPYLDSSNLEMLRRLAFDPWKDILRIEHKQLLLKQFNKRAESGELGAIRVALDLVGMWQRETTSTLPQELVQETLKLAHLAARPEAEVEDYEWKLALESLIDIAPPEVATLLADEITNVNSRRFDRRRYAEEMFRDFAKKYPDVAMQAIGKWVLNDQRKAVFRIFEFSGIFDAIGLQTVKPWVEKNGETAAIGIARHLEGPSVIEGEPRIPELADWLLSTYHEVPQVFREFIMGRHSGEVQIGHPRSRQDELEKRLSYFETSQKRWIQEWIKFERDHLQRDMEWHDRMDEEFERR